MIKRLARRLQLSGACVLFLALSTTSVNANDLSAWIPFELDGGHITLPATLNGVATTAVLDTGAVGNGIAKSFLMQHEGTYSQGSKIVVQGVFGQQETRLINGVSVQLLGADLKMGELVPMSLGKHGLLLGLPFFKDRVVQLDYPNQRMRIASRGNLDLREIANVEMRRSRGMSPLVKVDFNNEFSTWVTFDTGNAGGFAMRRVDAQRLDWLDRYKIDESLARGITGTVLEVDQFSLPQIELGPFILKNVLVSVPKSDHGTNIGIRTEPVFGTRIRKVESRGLLGFDVLRRFVVTIDLKRSLLHLEPSGTLD